MKKYVTYWLDSAKHDLEVSESLFASAKYDWCLFVAHLVMEKTLKGIFVDQKKDFPPRTYDLARLVQINDIEMDEETIEFLDLVNTFHMSTRYPDEKLRFYNLCTKEFTEKHYSRIKEIRRWLLKKIYQ